MKINYNNVAHTIEIKDDLKNHYLIMKFVMTFNVLNAFIRLINHKIAEYGGLEYFWVVIGIISLVALYFYFFKKSAAEIIKVAEIRQLKVTTFLGTKRGILELKNGKNRNLGKIKNNLELAELQELCNKIGISCNKT